MKNWLGKLDELVLTEGDRVRNVYPTLDVIKRSNLKMLKRNESLVYLWALFIFRSRVTRLGGRPTLAG